MSPPHKIVQKWQCPGCGATYDAPLYTAEVVCGKVSQHKTKATTRMKLIEGELKKK